MVAVRLQAQWSAWGTWSAGLCQAIALLGETASESSKPTCVTIRVHVYLFLVVSMARALGTSVYKVMDSLGGGGAPDNNNNNNLLVFCSLADHSRV